MTNNEENSMSKSEKLIEEELTYVFNQIASIFNSETKDISRKVSLRIVAKKVIKFCAEIFQGIEEGSSWEKKSFYSLIGSGFLFFMVALVIVLIRSFEGEPPIWLEVSGALLILGSMMFLLSFVVLNISRKWKSPSKVAQDFIEKVKEEAIADQIKVEELFGKASQHSLEIAKTKLQLLVEERQASERTTSSFLPILAIILVVLGIYTLGVPDQSLKRDLFYGAIAGVSGLVTVIALILKFTIELVAQSEIIKYKNCISLLEQAIGKVKKDK